MTSIEFVHLSRRDVGLLLVLLEVVLLAGRVDAVSTALGMAFTKEKEGEGCFLGTCKRGAAFPFARWLICHAI